MRMSKAERYCIAHEKTELVESFIQPALMAFNL